MNFQIITSEKELADLDILFSGMDLSEREQVLAEMRACFDSADAEKIWAMRYGFFYWYTKFEWQSLNSVDRDRIAKIVAKTSFEALLFDFDCYVDFCWYLGMKSLDKNQMELLYSKTKQAFLSSDTIVGSWQGKAVNIAECVRQMKLIQSYNYDSIKMAEFEGRLKQIIFPKPNTDLLFAKYVTIDPDVLVERFVDFMDFFLSVEPADIWEIIDEFLHPELKAVKQASVNMMRTNPPVAVENAVTAAVSPSNAEIQNQINLQFKRSADGNYEDVDSVFAKLEELAQKYQNPKIA